MLQVLLTAIGAMGDDEKLRHLLFLLDSLLSSLCKANINCFPDLEWSCTTVQATSSMVSTRYFHIFTLHCLELKVGKNCCIELSILHCLDE